METVHRNTARGRSVWLYLFLGATVALGVSALRRTQRSGGLEAPANRKPMPSLALSLMDGTAWRLASHRSQVVLINYWATWCEPCLQELPTLLQISREEAPNGLVIVGISLDSGADAPARVRQFAAAHHVAYPLAISAQTSPFDSPVAGLPTTILIDRQGRIASSYTGAVEPNELRKDLSTLLAEPAVTSIP